MSMIEFHDVNKYFGKFHALKNINLVVKLSPSLGRLDPAKVPYFVASMGWSGSHLDN